MADDRATGLGVRTRLLLWLALVILPIVFVSWLVIDVVDDRLSERVEVDLENVRRLEGARISDALEGYERDAVSLAAGPHVIDFVGGVLASREGTAESGRVIGGADGFDIVNPQARRPLNQLAKALRGKASITGSEVVGIRIVGRDGATYGESAGFTWLSYDDTVVERAMDSAAPVFGTAYTTPEDGDRLGLAAPVLSGGRVVGALMLETRLGPIVDLVVNHEGFGDTSEAHIAQPTADGDAEFITLLRFERDAAFSKVVPAEKGLPINQALTSPGGRVLRSPDYRAVDSILAIETIDATGWGLVVKIDAAEAFAPVSQVKRIVGFGALVVGIIVLVGWLLLARPLGRRLRSAAAAAERVASGEYQSLINDEAGDEIGDMARSIDRLATDLEADIKMRAEVEERLRHQASYDDLTELHNRQYAGEMIRDIFGPHGPATSSVLFLDLDRFKSINDTHGHAVGDEALVAVAQRLRGAVDQSSIVARWGGDEFVVIVPDSSAEDASAIAQRVKGLLRDPIITTAGPQLLTFSIGMATANAGRPVDEVLIEADARMFTEKQKRRAVSSPGSMTRQTVSSAIEEGRLEVWYQPIVTTSADGAVRLFGMEALVRLRAVAGELILPGEFLPEVEDTALGLALDRWVVGTALDDFARWHDGLGVDPGVLLALNFGGASLRDTELPQVLAEEVERRELSLDSLLIEVPEDVAELDISVVNDLHEAGAIVALDDFGSNRSNLDRLVEIHASVVKLDRRWARNLNGSRQSEEHTVLRRVVSMCRDLSVDLVAEGIETPDQLGVLRGFGLEAFQGFYFARPQPAVVFERKWLASPTKTAAT